jgi:hypothetical protein
VIVGFAAMISNLITLSLIPNWYPGLSKEPVVLSWRLLFTTGVYVLLFRPVCGFLWQKCVAFLMRGEYDIGDGV